MPNSDLIKYVTVEDGCAQLDHIEAIADLTGTAPADWVDADGPDSHVGVSYWYVHQTRNLTAYVSDDQQHISIQVSEHDGDTIASAEIDLNQLELG